MSTFTASLIFEAWGWLDGFDGKVEMMEPELTPMEILVMGEYFKSPTIHDQFLGHNAPGSPAAGMESVGMDSIGPEVMV